MILTGKIFKHRFAVNGTVFPPVIVTALSMSAADDEVMLYAESQWRLVNSEYRGAVPGGLEVRILEATEIDVGSL